VVGNFVGLYEGPTVGSTLGPVEGLHVGITDGRLVDGDNDGE
jgi:hypothetical protein